MIPVFPVPIADAAYLNAFGIVSSGLRLQHPSISIACTKGLLTNAEAQENVLHN